MRVARLGSVGRLHDDVECGQNFEETVKVLFGRVYSQIAQLANQSFALPLGLANLVANTREGVLYPFKSIGPFEQHRVFWTEKL